MANKLIGDLTTRSDFDATCNVPVDDGVQTWKATGAQIKTFVTPPSASASVSGLVDTSAQSFAGLKKFEGGAILVGNNNGNQATALTLSNTSNRIQRIVPTASIDVNMPTTSIKAQEVWILYNDQAEDATYDMTVKSSGGNTIETIRQGFIVLMALQDTPTTAAHWKVLDVYERLTTNHAFAYNNGSGGTPPGTLSILKMRRQKLVTVIVPVIAGTCTNADSRINSTTSVLPSRLLPGAGQNVAVRVKNSGSSLAALGTVELATNGIMYVWKDGANANFTASSVSGSESASSISFSIS